MISKSFAGTALLVISFQSGAANLDNGDELHLDNCTGCHDSGVYTRPDRKVTSLPRLGTQVRFCRDNLGITWFDDEVADVVHYLNTEYYKF